MSNGFDRDINRDGTNCLKYDGRQSVFGKADIIPAWVADMDFAAPAAVTQALIRRANHPIYGYTLFPDSLYRSVIHWLERRHQWEVQREWIIMCPGVVPSINAAIMAFTEPGDAVIIQPPVYFPFFSAVTLTGRKLVQNPLRFEAGNYTIDFDHLEQCAKTARLLLLCSPHNPVGRVWHKQELRRLLEISEKHNLLVFSDEIHADLIYPGHKHHTLASLTRNSANIMTAVTPSKTFNIPGLNLSTLIIPDATVRTTITQVLNSMHVSASNPFSIAAFEAAYQEGEAWLEDLLVYLRDTRDCIEAYLAEHISEIKPIKTEGTYLLWLDCHALKMNDTELKRFFIHEADVGMSPGTLFGQEGSGFMRLNMGAPRHTIMKVLENIKKALQKI